MGRARWSVPLLVVDVRSCEVCCQLLSLAHNPAAVKVFLVVLFWRSPWRAHFLSWRLLPLLPLLLIIVTVVVSIIITTSSSLGG